MNDSSAREMNDRQPQRPCRCVGIFFQLFDRNRRFAKKLFLKKLLSPACLKKASKKFGGDEKQPKLHLIADENVGGFPNAKNNGLTDTLCESKREMKAISFFARLMGFESMLQGSGNEADLVRNSLDHHSTDSYLSSSPNSSSKDKVLAESVDFVDDEPLFLEPDRDLSDCGTSLSNRRSCKELIHNVSGVINKIDQLKGSKLSYAKQVILNA
ncbi:hypothetical protein CQW23_25030 [Capsicum baccatum]|uniref:DUF3741 domain-containing protein n=1 Tax=Capsicum baccatum TaxID=33114 RepID=A0A2G2VWG9_CAPBA|nr:hypothetical protein CQW23_25030 [Capsicum baccatum]